MQDLVTAVDKHVASITAVVSELLNQVPPELSGDIHEGGIYLTGGSASIGILGPALAETTGLNVQVADQPALCVALGLQQHLLH